MTRILVADDDKTYRDSLQKVLERAGFGVESVADVAGALEAICTSRFDLILCDYRMPGQTGIDLLIELRRTRSKTPVLMISACVDAAVEARAKELGAFGLLRKPVRRRELIDRASSVGRLT